MSPLLKKQYTGFTLIELVVVIGIFSLMAGLVLFNFRAFQTTRSLDHVSQELAATIREAQIYGIAVRGLDSNPAIYPAYGLYLDNSQQIIFFADLNGDRVYTETGPSPDVVTSLFTMEPHIAIDKICTSQTGEDPGTTGVGNFQCVKDGEFTQIENATVMFERPNPEPYIYDSDFVNTDPVTGEPSRAFARIDIIDRDGFGKSVYIWRSGQVGIANPWEKDIYFAVAPSGPVCPVVHIWDGEKYVAEHKLASFSSLAHEQTNVVPFGTIGDTDAFVKLRIKEDIDESYIDHYALVAIDSPVSLDGLDVQLNSYGVGSASRKIAEPFLCEIGNGVPCRDEVANEDGTMIPLDALGKDGKQSMTVSFEAPSDRHNINLILKTRTHDVLDELADARLQVSPFFLYSLNLGIKIPLIKNLVGMGVLAEYLSMDIELWDGESWTPIGSQSVDDYRDLNTLVLPLPEDSLSLKTLQFRFSTNGQYFIDEIGLGVFEDIELKVQEAPLLSATNNDGVVDDEVKNALLLDDERYHVLPKGTFVDLIFDVPEKDTMDDRRYFSLFNGYYLVDSEGGMKGIDGVKNGVTAIKNIYQGDIDNIVK